MEERVGEEQGQGITRRDLLRKGAVLGGAVVWTTPVVQTLGMGRAFAQTASPEPNGDKEISYIGINVICNGSASDPGSYFVKWEDGTWESNAGAAPSCAEKDELPDGVDGSNGWDLILISDSCAKLTEVPTIGANCTVEIWVKAGNESSTDTPCNKYFSAAVGDIVCTSSS